MRMIQLTPPSLRPILQYESTGAASAILVTGTGQTRIHAVHFEPGGQIGTHPTGSDQLFLVVQGDGWVRNGEGRRIELAAGQGVFLERGEQHAKGSGGGMIALMTQVEASSYHDADDSGSPDDPSVFDERPRLELSAERLLLRPFVPEDASVFSAYRSDPEVARYQGWDAPFDLTQAHEFIAAMAQVVPGSPGAWCQLAICLRSTGDQVGDVAFRVLADEPQQGEIGFTLARSHQGHGYATEAVTALLGHLFGALGLHRVRAVCDVENPSSARVLERLGFRREGETCEATWFKGHWSSEYWYAILRREWAARGGGRS